MTITIGRRAVLLFLAVLLAAGCGVGGYFLGRSSKDTERTVRAAVKKTRAVAFEQGRAQGDQEGRKAIVDQERSPAEATSQVIEYLGHDDWKADKWYIVHIIRREGDLGQRIYSVNDRASMSPGLDYNLCGTDNESICYVEGG